MMRKGALSIAKATLVLILTVVIAASSILMVGPPIVVIVPSALVLVFGLRRNPPASYRDNARDSTTTS